MHIVTNIRHITRQHVTRSQLHTVNDGANVQFHWTHFVFECVCFFSLLYSLSITFIHSLIFLPFVCIYPCWLCVCFFCSILILRSLFSISTSFCTMFPLCLHWNVLYHFMHIFAVWLCAFLFSFFYFSLIFYVDYDFNWILSFFSSRIVFLIWNKYFSWLFHFVIGFFFICFYFMLALHISIDIYQKIWQSLLDDIAQPK